MVICSIHKDENKWLNEWVKHHFDIGVEHIFIHDNGSKVDPGLTLIEWVNRGFVTIIDVGDGRGLQLSVYNNFITKYREKYDYCAFIDVDEFINLKKDNNIDEFLVRHNDKNGIGLNMIPYLPENPEIDIDLVIPNNTKCTLTSDGNTRHIKTIGKLSEMIHAITPHNFKINGGTYTTNNTSIPTYHSNGITIDDAQLNHYIYRSDVDKQNKIIRGGGNGSKKNNNFFDVMLKLAINTDTSIIKPNNMKNPIINIITRTSGRPNAFKRCVNSVKNQRYKNINHIIITDDEKNVDYINENGYNDCVVVDRKQLIKLDESIDPGTGSYSPHNLYINGVNHLIKDGWVMYLDDDDYLINNNVVEVIINEINKNDEDTIIYWRMQYQNGMVLPSVIDKTNPPQLGGIGSPCFTFNKKYLEHTVWDGWKCADYRVINKLHNKIPKFSWLPKSLIMIPSAGFGNKNDI